MLTSVLVRHDDNVAWDGVLMAPTAWDAPL